ncbi:MAG: AN1-type zinc finger domain-containing protein [Candidatus Hodarchaeales archaeon]
MKSVTVNRVLLYLPLFLFTAGTFWLMISLGRDYYLWFGALLLVSSVLVLVMVFFTDFSLSRINFFYSSSRKRQDVLFSKYAPRKPAMSSSRRTKLYSTCHKCQKSTYLPFKCKYCEGEFCTEHRLPENHVCPFFNRDKND